MEQPSIKAINLTLFGRCVGVGRVYRRMITTIPNDYAKRLGIIEGLTKLEVTIENGALIYRPISGTEPLGSMEDA